MNRPSEELLHRVVENRATAAEAADVAAWLGTEAGQIWARDYIGRDFEQQQLSGEYESLEIPSEEMMQRISASLLRSRRQRLLLRVAAVVIPLAVVLGVTLHFDRQVGGIFSQTEYANFVVERGKRTQCLFQDGTIAYLNAESKIHYPVKFGLSERRIRLDGEAYFEVTSNARRPFVVQFEGGEIRVLGTAFNVKAYAGEELVAVTLDQGHVAVLNDRGERFDLQPTEQLLYNRRTQSGMIVRESDAVRYSIWKDDVISFKDTPLDEVLVTLARWYDVRFELTGLPPQNYLYTFKTDNTLLDHVLREMELITPIRFERREEQVKVDFR